MKMGLFTTLALAMALLNTGAAVAALPPRKLRRRPFYSPSPTARSMRVWMPPSKKLSTETGAVQEWVTAGCSHLGESRWTRNRKPWHLDQRCSSTLARPVTGVNLLLLSVVFVP
jgi:hypothetical protein